MKLLCEAKNLPTWGVLATLSGNQGPILALLSISCMMGFNKPSSSLFIKKSGGKLTETAKYNNNNNNSSSNNNN